MELKADSRLRSQIRLPIELAGSEIEPFYRLVKRAFDLKDVLDLTIVNHHRDGEDTLLFLRFAQDIPIVAEELGEMSGVVIREGGELNLRFDSKGELKSYELEKATGKVTENARRDFSVLLKAKKVYFARYGEKVDVGKLAASGQRFYLQMDASGKKRLRRAYTG